MFDQFLDFMFSRWFWIPAIFFYGIFLIYLGKRRLRVEAQPDPRYDMIPDEDVKKFWRWMSKYDIWLSRFYIYFWGPFLIIFAIINSLMLLVFNAQITDEFISKEQFSYFAYLNLFLYMLSEGPSMNTSIGIYGCGGSIVKNNKLVIFNIYKSINFRSIKEKDWIEKNLKPPIGSPKNFYRQEIDSLKRINYIPSCWTIGHILWFTVWIVFFVYFTVRIYQDNFLYK